MCQELLHIKHNFGWIIFKEQRILASFSRTSSRLYMNLVGICTSLRYRANTSFLFGKWLKMNSTCALLRTSVHLYRDLHSLVHTTVKYCFKVFYCYSLLWCYTSTQENVRASLYKGLVKIYWKRPLQLFLSFFTPTKMSYFIAFSVPPSFASTTPQLSLLRQILPIWVVVLQSAQRWNAHSQKKSEYWC